MFITQKFKIICMKQICIVFILLSVFSFEKVNAQISDKWVIGLGVNIIDNDGSPYSDLLSSRKCWNSITMPSSLTVEYKYNDMFSFEFHEALNCFEKGKFVNKSIILKNQYVTATQLNGKFHINSLYSGLSWFDPYFNGGFGITTIDRNVLLQPNLAVGSNFWIAEGVALSFQGSANFGISKVYNNFLMYTISLKSNIKNL